MTDCAAFAALLEDCYRRIGERSMRDLPIYNDALSIAAIGFDIRNDAISGILVTPWFMNLILVPRDGSLASRATGSSFSHAFAAGAIDFTVGDIDGVGRIASSSLFSPMFEFDDMEAAKATATAAMIEILTSPAAEQDQARKLAPAVDRRNFLRGALTEPRP